MKYLHQRLARLENGSRNIVTHCFINPTETDAQLKARIVQKTGAPATTLYVLRLWDVYSEK
jgi:hypothetical protein